MNNKNLLNSFIGVISWCVLLGELNYQLQEGEKSRYYTAVFFFKNNDATDVISFLFITLPKDLYHRILIKTFC